MRTIRITNAKQIVLEKKGWLVANVVGAVVDMEAQVESIVVQRLRASLASEGVEAIIEQVVG
ncbi:MAG: cytochrome-c oxidase [Polyangiaceae bacterium]